MDSAARSKRRLNMKAGNFRPIIHAWKDKPPEGQLIEPYASLDQHYEVRVDPYWNGFYLDCLLTVRIAIEDYSLALRHRDLRKLFRDASLGRHSLGTGKCGDHSFYHHIYLTVAGELTIRRIRVTGADSIDEGTVVHLAIPRFNELCNKIRKQDWALTEEERHKEWTLEGSPI